MPSVEAPKKRRRPRAKVKLLMFSKADFATALGFCTREFDRMRATGELPAPEFRAGTPGQRWHRSTVIAVARRLCGKEAS